MGSSSKECNEPSGPKTLGWNSVSGLARARRLAVAPAPTRSARLDQGNKLAADLLDLISCLIPKSIRLRSRTGGIRERRIRQEPHPRIDDAIDAALGGR